MLGTDCFVEKDPKSRIQHSRACWTIFDPGQPSLFHSRVGHWDEGDLEGVPVFLVEIHELLRMPSPASEYRRSLRNFDYDRFGRWISVRVQLIGLRRSCRYASSSLHEDTWTPVYLLSRAQRIPIRSAPLTAGWWADSVGREMACVPSRR